MTDLEKVDAILGNADMRAEAKVVLHELFAGEVIPFMDKYDDFVNAKSDKARGLAFAAIFEKHLVKGCGLELNLEESVMDELRAFGPSPGPIASVSPLVGLLAAAADQLKVVIAGTLTGQMRTSPQFESAQKLLAQAAQPPATTGSGRLSLSGTFKNFLTRGFTSHKTDSPPSSTGSPSSSQPNDAHRASGVSSTSSRGRGRGGSISSISSRGGRSMSGIYGSGTTPARITYTPRDITWDRLEQPGSTALLNKCLANAKVRTMFGEFLAKQRNLEGLLFLESCVVFFQAPTLESFNNLTASYIQPEAQNQINIGVPARAAIDGALSALNLDEARAAVELAETDVYRLVAHDPLRRFQNDPAFLDFLATPEGAELFPELLAYSRDFNLQCIHQRATGEECVTGNNRCQIGGLGMLQ